MKRLWISSVTDKAIREGFAHLRRGEDYKPLYDAALCRAEADWLVGMNATRALTCKYNAQLSCGRVQTPTLAIVAKQEEKIRKFVPETFYGLNAYAKGITLMWSDQKSGSSRTFDKNRIQEIKKKVTGKEAVITEMKTSRKKTFPPLLYDLTELQKDAYRRFGFSPKETLNIMQRLYENHKVLTYPRTDSRYISSDIVPTLKDRVQACAVGPYRKAAGKVFKGPFTKDAPFVNDKKVSDHHAVIPTQNLRTMELAGLPVGERAILELVALRLLCAVGSAYEYAETTVVLKCAGHPFTAKGRSVICLGGKHLKTSIGPL